MAEEVRADAMSDEAGVPVELSEGSRRDFINRLVGAGVLAASGLLAGGAASAEEETSDDRGVDRMTKTDTQLLKIDGVVHKIEMHKEQLSVGYLKIDRGFRLVLRGPGLGDAFQASGLVGRDADTDRATITIEFRA